MSAFLKVESLSRHFGGHKAVDDVSFGLEEGALTALIGPNGAGKTTLFNLVSGALAPTSGRVWFRGKPVAGSTGVCALGMARTFQNARLFHEMTVLENVMTGMGGLRFRDSLWPWPRGLEPERRRMKRAYYLLEDLGLADAASQPAGEIPFGRQRLAAIARALALEPRLLLLDEPAAGLNATETAALASLLRRLNDRGITLLLVEHDMTFVMSLARRVLVLDRGRLIGEGSPAEIRASPAVCEAYLGRPPC